MSNVNQMFDEMLRGMTAVARATAEHHPAQRKLDAIVAAYKKALEDPNAKIPTLLHATIEQARK